MSAALSMVVAKPRPKPMPAISASLNKRFRHLRQVLSAGDMVGGHQFDCFRADYLHTIERAAVEQHPAESVIIGETVEAKPPPPELNDQPLVQRLLRRQLYRTAFILVVGIDRQSTAGMPRRPCRLAR